MYKSTIQQIVFFCITTYVNFTTGKYLVNLSDIKSFKDFAIIMIFFISLILFINYFSRLISKLIRAFSF